MLRQLTGAALLTTLASTSTHASDADVIAAAQAAYSADFCFAFDMDAGDLEVTRHTLSWRPDWLENDQPDRTIDLIEIICLRGAYNFGYVYFMQDEDEGIRPLHFAMPALDIDYADEESTQLRSMDVTGFASEAVLINPQFDPESAMLSSYSKWRGIGDAFSAGQWQFEDGNFVLKSFAVDPTYDGQIDPVTVYGEESSPQ